MMVDYAYGRLPGACLHTLNKHFEVIKVACCVLARSCTPILDPVPLSLISIMLYVHLDMHASPREQICQCLHIPLTRDFVS